jgi:Na+/H+ antiporter NhaD/arsenite permease-like protein
VAEKADTARVLLASALLSQVISNVPCAILLSGFTSYWRELLLGVNIGGMGTIIASLASVISYKFYSSENPQKAGKYIAKFTLYNVIGVAVFAGLNYLLIRFLL